ncbi:MAG: ROK family protein [Chloroflexota bacterium]|nr:ROK family protein [Chloroflexota bacterium]
MTTSSPRAAARALGIDIGGTGIKAAVVDPIAGELVTERVRELTPQPSTPSAVIDVVADVARRLELTGMLTAAMPAGAGFPSVIKDGKPMTAANLDHAWIGAPVREMLEERLGRPTQVLNDADAAGVAEMAHGAGKGQHGVVLMLTVGTGIGSALFTDGQLVPNLELGHVEFRGHDAETLLSGAARERRQMSWKKWGHEFSDLLTQYEFYLWPDLIILGGGVSKELGKFQKYLKTRAPLVPAAMLNTAGIVGAAMAGSGAGSRARRPSRP